MLVLELVFVSVLIVLLFVLVLAPVLVLALVLVLMRVCGVHAHAQAVLFGFCLFHLALVLVCFVSFVSFSFVLSSAQDSRVRIRDRCQHPL